MQLSSLYSDLYFYVCSFFSWRDALEIIFFSTAFYYFSVWLNTDKTKNLLSYFYAYLAALSCAYYLQLFSIHFFLLYSFPFLILFFCIVHQHILQKNFISLRNKPPATIHDDNWLETIIQICLQTINNNKEIHIIIEQNCCLQEFLQTSLAVDAPINNKLLMLLIMSETFNQKQFIWISQAKVRGINTHLQPSLYSSLENELKTLDQWHQDALLITYKTDALVISISPTSRSFTLMQQGKKFEQLPGQLLLNILKKSLSTSITKKDLSYENSKSSIKQHNAS